MEQASASCAREERARDAQGPPTCPARGSATKAVRLVCGCGATKIVDPGRVAGPSAHGRERRVLGHADDRHEGSSSNSNSSSSRRRDTRRRCTGRTRSHPRCTRTRRRNIPPTTCKATRRTPTGGTKKCRRSGHPRSSTGSPQRASTPPSHTRTHQKGRGCPRPRPLGHLGRPRRPHHARWIRTRSRRDARRRPSQTATGE